MILGPLRGSELARRFQSRAADNQIALDQLVPQIKEHRLRLAEFARKMGRQLQRDHQRLASWDGDWDFLLRPERAVTPSAGWHPDNANRRGIAVDDSQTDLIAALRSRLEHRVDREFDQPHPVRPAAAEPEGQRKQRDASQSQQPA